MSAKPTKPAPKSTNVACELCGLAWDKHGPEPTPLTCIDLLKAELSKRPSYPYVVTGVTPDNWVRPSATGFSSDHPS